MEVQDSLVVEEEMENAMEDLEEVKVVVKVEDLELGKTCQLSHLITLN